MCCIQYSTLLKWIRSKSGIPYHVYQINRNNYWHFLFFTFIESCPLVNHTSLWHWRSKSGTVNGGAICNNTSPASTMFLVVASTYETSRSHSFRHTAVGRTPLDEWSAPRRNLYLTTHNTYEGQTSMPRRYSNPHSQQASGRRPTP
jgi:hypothetical protein